VENSSQAIDLYELKPSRPISIVFGHETDGVTSALARRIETHVRIPMLGEKRSLNVATAAGVVLYELLRRHRDA
jgi:23S rRNA (guanosine2251-2'-O)-methyltransferase